MNSSTVTKYAMPALLASVVVAAPAMAQDVVATSLASPGAKGDTAWMLTATTLVLLMTVPGLALFYGGLVRTKNMLSVLTQVFAIACVVSVIWVIYGYSVTFTNGGAMNDFYGGFSKIFLQGVSTSTGAATFSNGVYIPEYVYICFQMTFAMITPGLIVGAFAERIKFSSMLVFMVLWVTFIYFPMAHMVWYWGGPDAFGGAQGAADAKAAVATSRGAGAFDAATDAASSSGARWILPAVPSCTSMPALPASSARSSSASASATGKEQFVPHSLTMTMIGGSLLWVGWFGFNAGSNLEANATAALAMINTFVATAAAARSWLFVEWAVKGKPSLLGMISGAVAGLVAVTPACGFSGPMGAVVLGLVVSVGVLLLRLDGEECARL